jgi:hypothetical protein
MNDTQFLPLASEIPLRGYTPDPDDLCPVPDIPPIPSIPELEPNPPELIVADLLPCSLSLDQGCYEVRLECPNLASPRYAGTMRVENGENHTTISGDLYQFAVGRTQLVTPPVIPIFPRNHYYSYLKVIGHTKPWLQSPPLNCYIILTVEEYRYTPPEVGDVSGSFPETPTRTLSIVLRKTADPAGYAGPSFEGSVYDESDTLLPDKFTMLWVSDFYRRARLELENVFGATIPQSAGTDNFQTIYATTGWDLTVQIGNTNLPVPAGISGKWSAADLHAFMLANRNPAADLDMEWWFYHVSLPLDFAEQPGIDLKGIMFDDLDDVQREGACSFIGNFSGVFNDDGVKLRSAAHEVGHGFNLVHPMDENPPAGYDNSIMSVTDDVKELFDDLLAEDASSPLRFPDDINFAFNEHNRHHLIHSPDVVVRPGGEDFGYGHWRETTPEAADNSAAARLKLHLKPANERLRLGEPLWLRLELVNEGEQTVLAPSRLGTAFDCVEIHVGKLGEEARRLRPFVIACDSDRLAEFKPGGRVTATETIYWDTHGFFFQSPGMHRLEVEVSWRDGGQPFAAKAAVDVWVDFPTSEIDNRIAALLLDREVGIYVALGGNARHLKKARERLDAAARVAPDHPAVQSILELTKSRHEDRLA